MGFAKTLTGDVRLVLMTSFDVARARWRWLAGAVLATAVLALVLVQYDRALLRAVRTLRSRNLRYWARWFSEWGDFQTGSLILGVVVLVVGIGLRSAAWRRAALASVLASSLAGVTSLSLRTVIGRPRPAAKLPDVAHGPSLNYDLHGFPSSHAATSFGTASALVVALPVMGVPVAVGAVAVVWSRMYRKRHHPTDVAVGAMMGILFGVVAGLGARRSLLGGKEIGLESAASIASAPATPPS